MHRCSYFGEVFKQVNSSPDFSWSSNPASADTEIILGEMLRSKIGVSDQFSFRTNGLVKACLSKNDSLLLSEMSSRCKFSQDAKKVVYGGENLAEWKALRLGNITEFRSLSYVDEFGRIVDVVDLEKLIVNDMESGLTPYFVIISLRDSCPEALQKLLLLKKEYKFELFLDLAEMDLNSLEPSNLPIEELNESDYIHLDLSKLSGLSSSFLFCKDRNALSNAFTGTDREYFKTSNAELKSNPRSREFLTDTKYDAHKYNIGFGHETSVFRLFYTVHYLGADGILEWINSLNTVAEYALSNLQGELPKALKLYSMMSLLDASIIEYML